MSATRIDLPALRRALSVLDAIESRRADDSPVQDFREALATLDAHRELLAAAMEDLAPADPDAWRPVSVQAALRHVLDDEFHGPENRGGS